MHPISAVSVNVKEYWVNLLVRTPPPQHRRSCISPTHLHLQKKENKSTLQPSASPNWLQQMVSTKFKLQWVVVCLLSLLFILLSSFSSWLAGSFAEYIVPEDPALKFAKVGDLFWSLPHPPQTDNSIVKSFFRRVSKFVYAMLQWIMSRRYRARLVCISRAIYTCARSYFTYSHTAHVYTNKRLHTHYHTLTLIHIIYSALSTGKVRPRKPSRVASTSISLLACSTACFWYGDGGAMITIV